MKEFTCLNCNKIFKGQVYRNPRKYCSHKCSNEHKRRDDRPSMEKVSCKNCNKEFSAKKKDKRKFCSLSCSASFNTENKFDLGAWARKKEHERVSSRECRSCSKPTYKNAYCKNCWEKKKLIKTQKRGKEPVKGLYKNNCSYCGDEYKSKSKSKSFCSQNCAVKFDDFISPKGNKSSSCKTCLKPIEAHNTWCGVCIGDAPESQKRPDMKLGKLKKLFPYPLWRRKVSLQGHKTAKNVQDKCLHCGFDEHVELCHIKPIKNFSDDAMYIAEVNCEENLVKLCPNHHWSLDSGKLSIKKLFNLE